jgi:hypothetical protein
VPVFKRPGESGKGIQPFIGTENGWQYGRKRDRGIEDIFEVGRVWKVHIMPIIHKLVEIFKGPPKPRAEQKQLGK